MLAAISIGTGIGIISKNLLSRFVTHTTNQKLEKLTSPNAKERLDALELLVKNFGNFSAQNQVAIVKAMTSLFNDDNKDIIKKVIVIITAFIEANKFNHPDTIQAYVDGTVAVLKKISIQHKKAVKIENLPPMQAHLVKGLAPHRKYSFDLKDPSEVILQFHKYIVEKNNAESVLKIKTIDLSKLHCSLDNLIIDDKNLWETIQAIKRALSLSNSQALSISNSQALPQLASQQLALSLTNACSQNVNTRASAIEGLFEAFDKNLNRQIEILKALFKMLLDNKEMPTDKPFYKVYIGQRAFEKIETLIFKIPQGDFEKIQAVVDELAKYIKNPGVIYWSDKPDENRGILYYVTNSLLMAFLGSHYEGIEDGKIDLNQLNLNLKTLNESISVLHYRPSPHISTTTMIKSNIEKAISQIKYWHDLRQQALEQSSGRKL